MSSAGEASPPIFILCCERSGSTLLRYILDTHPEICSPGELALGWVAGYFSTMVERTLGQTVPAPERAALVASTTRRSIGEVMEAYARAKGKRLWCDKTPMNLQRLPELERVFPDARYLCLYRHCMDVAHSCLESGRGGFMPELAEYIRQSPSNFLDAMVASWVDKTSAQLAFEAEHPSRCFRVKYESLVFDPVGTLEPLFGFLGVGFDPKLVDRVFEVPHDEGGGDGKIRYTGRIEDATVGKGSALPAGSISKANRERMNGLLRALDYPEVGEDWGRSPSPYRPERASAPVIGSVREVFERYIPERLAATAGRPGGAAVRCRIKVSGNDGGVWVLDLTSSPGRVLEGDGDAPVSLMVTQDCLLDIMNRRVNPLEAASEGRLTLDGDPELAIGVASRIF